MKLTVVAVLVAFFVACPLSAEAGSRHRHHRSSRRVVVHRSVYRPVRHIVIRPYYRSYYAPRPVYVQPQSPVVIQSLPPIEAEEWSDRELEELAVMKAAAVRGWEEDDLAATVVERDYRRRTGVLEEAELVLRHGDETFTVVLKFDRYGQFEKLKVKVK